MIVVAAATSDDTAPSWDWIRATTSRYRAPSPAISVGQMAGSFLPCVGLYALMYASLALTYWATLALSVVTAAFMVRIFIIQHDCGHGSFFRSRRANARVGMLCSLFMLTLTACGGVSTPDTTHTGTISAAG
jgi:omega-6 fatty acid desaturase (delta-12 desaturase)